MKTTKDFDCIAVKREGALKIYEETKNLSLDQELAYWDQRTEELRRAIDSAVEMKSDSLSTLQKP